MLNNAKALVVVLAIAGLLLKLGKPILLQYMSAEDFRRRRNIWLTLTVLGFLSPSIWLYALVAMPLMYWGSNKDSNPLAFYVFLAFVIPNARIQIPVVGIGQLFELNRDRMMSLAILLPLIFSAKPVAGMNPSRRFTPMDWIMVCFGVLQLILALPFDSPTTTLRRAVLYILDTFVMYYAFARIAPSPKAIREVIAGLVFAILIISGVGAFETLRGWLLYMNIGLGWGAPPPPTAWLIRGGLLRAQASADHSLFLGLFTATGFGLWLYLSALEKSLAKKAAVMAILATGCFVTGSRGAWVTAILISIAYVALHPNAGRFLRKLIPVVAILILVAYMTPLKESFLDKLPVIGHSDQDTVEYRQQIAELSWRLIKLHPFFGDPFVLRNMEQLRQGEGIIDLVNGYANVALFNGGVGFTFFVGVFVMVIWKTYSTMVRFRSTDPDLAMMGACLTATLLGSLFFIGTAATEPITYWIAGIMAAYSAMRATVPARVDLRTVSSGARRAISAATSAPRVN